MTTTQTNTPQRIELPCPAVEVEAALPDQTGEVLPRFSMVAYTGDAMRVGAWRHPVVVDLEGLSVGDQRLPIRFGHSERAGVGHTERIVVEGGQLLAEGVVSRDTPEAREIVTSGKRGFPWQASIGAAVVQSELVREGRYVQVNARRFEGPVYVVRKATLEEISFVDRGADRRTSASIAATMENPIMSKDTPTPGNPAPGTTGSAGTPANPDVTSAATEPQNRGADSQSDDPQRSVQATAAHRGRVDASGSEELDQIIARSRAEHERRTRIVDLTAKAVVERPELADDMDRLCKTALQAKWDVQRYELEMLRVSRRAPGVIVRQRTGNDATVIEAALCRAGGLEAIEQLYDDQVLTAADQRFRHGLGLGELLLMFAQSNGYHGAGRSNLQELLQFAFNGHRDASLLTASGGGGGSSTLSLPGILSNVANKFLRAGFEAVESTWRNVAAIRPVRDFKQVTSYSLTGGFQYEEVAPGGELKHATAGETAYTNQARTYGRMFSIDRRDIINDDLDALTAVPRRLGRGAALKLNDVFWSTYLNNASFFTVGNKNYADGADTALTIDGLNKAYTLFSDQTDPDGHPLSVTPVILLVPNALFVLASQLMNSTEVREDGSSSKSKYPTNNPFAGMFRVVRSSYLSNVTYTGASAKAWYLLADPNDMPVIEVAFLNGQQRPTVENADADFATLGIQMRGYHDFGCALQEPRGGVKLKGEV